MPQCLIYPFSPRTSRHRSDRGVLELHELAALHLHLGGTNPVFLHGPVPVDDLPAPVETALAKQQIDGVLHFSRRSVQAYLECARRAGLLARALEPLQFCLSDQVAQPLAMTDCAGIKIAPHPDEAALIALVDRGR